MKALLERSARRPATCSTMLSSRRTPTGFDALVADLDACTWDELIARSGLGEAQMREIAGHYAAANATMVTWCMGLTHHPEAVATIQQVVNLLLLRGNIGRRGAGAMPVRGHSNVQGDRTMGATSTVTSAWLDNLEADLPRRARCAAMPDAMPPACIEGLFDGSVQALLSLGGNFGVASPDSPRVLAALERCRFTLHIATKLNRTHCHPGDGRLLLPTLGRTDRDLRPGGEQCISTEDSSSTVRASRGIQAPISEQQRSEPAIVAATGAGVRLRARRCRGPASPTTTPRSATASSVPARRHRRLRTVQRQAAKRRPLRPAEFRRATRMEYRQRQGAVHRACAARRYTGAAGAPRHGDAVLTLMTIRAHDQFNTTVYSSDDRYRDVAGDRHVVFVNAEDLAARGLRRRRADRCRDARRRRPRAPRQSHGPRAPGTSRAAAAPRTTRRRAA